MQNTDVQQLKSFMIFWRGNHVQHQRNSQTCTLCFSSPVSIWYLVSLIRCHATNLLIKYEGRSLTCACVMSIFCVTKCQKRQLQWDKLRQMLLSTTLGRNKKDSNGTRGTKRMKRRTFSVIRRFSSCVSLYKYSHLCSLALDRVYPKKPKKTRSLMIAKTQPEKTL